MGVMHKIRNFVWYIVFFVLVTPTLVKCKYLALINMLTGEIEDGNK